MQDFVHLHVHSQYSVLDGQASIPKLVDKAIADGMRGMALTDHGNMMGCKEFFNYVSKVRGKGKDAVRKLEDKLQKLNAGDFPSAMALSTSLGIEACPSRTEY